MGYFDAQRPATVERTMRSQVNYEFYYFADEVGKSQFDSDPLRWCGTVTDPISRNRFRPTAESAHAEHAGVPFFFESKENLSQFATAPDSLSVMQQPMLDAGRD